MASATEHGSTVLNKIIIPVVTTVLGATAIYFLGFNKKSSGRTDMEQMLISKDATLKAWKSFVTVQNVYYKNENSLQQEFTQKMEEAKKQAQSFEDIVPVLKDYQNEIMRERKKTTQDVENIVKDQDVDRDFLSMLNRVLDDSKDYDNKVSEFFDNIFSILKSNKSETEKSEKFTAEANKFEQVETNMNNRIIDQAESIAKVLADRYTQAFDLNELQAYVNLKKDKEKKPVDSKPAIKTDQGVQTPIDPSGAAGAEVKQNNPPSENGASSSNNNSTDHNTKSNTIEPTESLLTGQWSMTGGSGTLELSSNGKMFWVFNTKGYTSGDWALANGKLEMNAVNPDTKKSSYLVGYLSDVTRNSFTLTFMSTPKEVYYLTRKK